MKILIVASYNKGYFSPFITEQAQALSDAGYTMRYFGVVGHGLFGYLKHIKALKQYIKIEKPDIIHAHYGLCGLLANLQRQVPVVTTYHGSDINNKWVLQLSRLAMLLSKWNIFISEQSKQIANPRKHYSVIPCGINLTDDQLINQQAARLQMKLDINQRYVLFAGAFDNTIKNAPLAKQVVSLIEENSEFEDKVELLELKGYTRAQVNLLMCAANVLLLTSFSEGSPQVIKEAMACGCPIVSVDVGDVRQRLMGLAGCYVADTDNASELADLLQQALHFEQKTKGREVIVKEGLDNKSVVKKLIEIYHKI